MLYITTRDNRDAYTAYRALHESIAPDGGAYVPFRFPEISLDVITAFSRGSFGQTVADILNRFFSCHLTGWDVDFAIGRSPVKLESMSHRMIVAELWHNPDGLYKHISSALYNKLSESDTEFPSEWFELAVHISVLFGIYGEICRTGIISAGERFDITVTANDLSLLLAAVYAKQMGMPLGTIILTAEESSGLWDLIHLGELSASAGAAEQIGIERLVHAKLGCSGVASFCRTVSNKKSFRIDGESLPSFNRGLFCSVIGMDRCNQHINSIYRSNSYLIDPIAACSAGGLQDYRAKTGESILTLVLSCTSPMNCISQISEATGIHTEKLSSLLTSLQGR